MNKVLLLSVALAFFSTSMTAQSVITGTVTDTQGVPMPGAKVQVKGTDEKVLTNMDGTFSIASEQSNPKLRVEYVGWKSVTVNGMDGMNIQMGTSKLTKYHWFAGVNVAIPEFKLNTLSPGVMFGCVKDYGWYVKGQFSGTVSVVDGTGWYTGNEKRRYWSVSAGALARIYGPLFAYLGAGYEERNIYWEFQDGTYCKADASYNGAMGDIGLMYRYKKFYIQGGVQLAINSNMYAKGNFGLGIYF